MTVIKGKKLQEIEFDEVSTVPSGDNPPAKIVLLKAEQCRCEKSTDEDGDGVCDECGMMMAGKKSTTKKSLIERFTEFLKGVPEDGDLDESQIQEFLEGTLNNKSTKEDKVTKTSDDVSKDDIDFDDLPEEVKKYIGALEDENDDLVDAVETLSKALDEDDDDEGSEDEIEGLLAKADPEFRAVIEKMRDDAEAARTEAKEAKEAVAKAAADKLHAEVVSKADGLTHVPGSQAERVELIEKAYQVDTEFGEKLVHTLDTMSKQIAKSALFNEIGSSTSEASLGDELEKAAAEYMAKDANLTKPQAISKALDNNPSLYK